MLVSFLGSPCSGKTTTASGLFTKLKESGMAAEWLPEYARIHIIRKRVKCMDNETSFAMDDDDQLAIFRNQVDMETMFERSMAEVRGSIVVEDTSSLNALLYMERQRDASGRPVGIPRKWEDPALKKAVLEHLQVSNILFLYSKKVDMPIYLGCADPNRVHTDAQSKEIEDLVPELIRYFGIDSYSLLVGSMETRLSRAHECVCSRLQGVKSQKKATA